LPRFGEGGRALIGGKNKSFFFFSYEGLRNSSNNVATGFVETPQFRQLVLQQRPNSVTAKVLSAPGVEPRIINVLAPSCGIFNNDATSTTMRRGALSWGTVSTSAR
jgi:hypothetical protein